MTQEQWIQAVKKGLRGGPLRFEYKGLRLVYILRNTGSEDHPSYSLRVERDGKMLLASTGPYSLERVLEQHPLDRLTPERQLEIEV